MQKTELLITLCMAREKESIASPLIAVSIAIIVILLHGATNDIFWHYLKYQAGVYLESQTYRGSIVG